MDANSVARKPAKQRIFTNLLLDVVLFLVFLMIYEEHATGITIHEWGALALASVAVVHMLLHWQWIVAFGKRFFQRIKGEIRFNYIVNSLLFVALTTVTFSGLMMSEVVMPVLGIEIGQNGFWHWLHALSADVSLGLMALHLALHWKWIFSTVQRLLIGSSPRKTIASPKPSVAIENEF